MFKQKDKDVKLVFSVTIILIIFADNRNRTAFKQQKNQTILVFWLVEIRPIHRQMDGSLKISHLDHLKSSRKSRNESDTFHIEIEYNPFKSHRYLFNRS